MPANVNNLNNNDQMYLVIRSLKNGSEKIDYEIKVGDILKIGRVKFAVKAMNIVTEKGEHQFSEMDIEESEYKELKEVITDPK